MTASLPKVAVLVVGYNSRSYLDRLFDSLNATKAIWRVYFLDNASSDDSLAWVTVHHPQVVAIRSDTNLGFAGGNNAMARRATGEGADVLFLVNPDTTIEPDTVSHLLAEHGPNRILQPLILTSEEGKQTSRINTSGNPLHPLGFSYAGGNGSDARTVGDSVSPIAIASGAACWIPASLMSKLGWFDESFFMYHEDSDLSWRAQLAGAEVMLVPAAVVYHDYHFGKSRQKYYYIERNRLLMVTKNYQWWSLLVLLPFGLVTEVSLIFFAAFEGFLPAKLKAYGGYVRLLPSVLRERRRVQTMRQVSDRTMACRMTAVLQFSEVESSLLKPYNVFSRLFMVIFRLII